MVGSVTFSPVTRASRIFRSRCNDSDVGKKFRRFRRFARGRETRGSEIFVRTTERAAAEALRNSGHPYESLDILPTSPSSIESPYKRLGGSRAQPLIRPNLKYTFHFSTVLPYPALNHRHGRPTSIAGRNVRPQKPAEYFKKHRVNVRSNDVT